MAAAIVASPTSTTTATRTPASDHRERERQLDAPAPLARRHPDAVGRLEHRRIDVADAGVRVAQDRQQRVDDERHDRRARADAADERDGNQEPEEREARDRLHDVGEAENRPREARPARQGDSERERRSRPRSPRRPRRGRRARRSGRGSLRAAPRDTRRSSLILRTPPRTPRTNASAGERVSSSRVPDLADAAALEDRHAVREPEGLAEIVGDQKHRRLPPRLPVPELPLHRPPRDRIEGAEGLVHQNERRPRRQSAGDSHPLPLAARETGGTALGEDVRRQAHQFRAARPTARAARTRSSRAGAAPPRRSRAPSSGERARPPG